MATLAGRHLCSAASHAACWGNRQDHWDCSQRYGTLGATAIISLTESLGVTRAHAFGRRSLQRRLAWIASAPQNVLHNLSQDAPRIVQRRGQEGAFRSQLNDSSISSAGQKEGSKQCSKCHRSKLVEDFQKLETARDGRYEWCRACIAVQRAVQSESCPAHLQMSVDEAWEQSRPCCCCKHVKELRDFAKDLRHADGICRRCRACSSDQVGKVPERAPMDNPQVCRLCKELKPASVFYPNKKRFTGRENLCKACHFTLHTDQARKRKAQAKVPRTEKRCSECRIVKQASEFNKASSRGDGLSNKCKPCNMAYHEQRRRAK